MATRRELLSAIPAFMLPDIATTKTPQSRIEDLANELALALSTLDGSGWKWTLDAKGEFLIMTRSARAKLQ